jgi:hypothetical protein
LRYVESLGINPSAGALGKYIFRANSVYDPNSSGTGHQPLGFDVWATVYNHYVVLGSTIKCTFLSSETTVSCPLAVGVMLDDDGSIPNAARTIMEQGRSAYTLINSRDLAAGNGVKLANKYDAQEFFATNPLDNADMSAVVTTNPARTAAFTVWCGDFAESADPGSISVLVDISYDVVFFKPKDQVEN